MADGRLPMRPGHTEVKEASVASKRRPGSEIIRKKVHQLPQSSSMTISVDATRDENTDQCSLLSGASQNNVVNGPDSDSGVTLLQISNTSRSLKRKKSKTSTCQIASAKPENWNMNLNKTLQASSSSSYASSSRIPANRTVIPSLDPRIAPTPSQTNTRHHSLKCHSQHGHDSNGSDGTTSYWQKTPGDYVFSGPLAAAEFERMKKEIQTLKETLHESKKTSKRYSKKLEESKAELIKTLSLMQEKESELSAISEKYKTAKELLSTIESSIHCQICMDLPDRPFALSPCGHVLCLSCLQEWFRKAPPTLDDMDIDPEELSDPHYILMRSKSCPSCRATVKRRPVPVFMVKAVVAALNNRDGSAPSAGESSAPNAGKVIGGDDDDPWRGIFPSSDEDEGDGDSEFDVDSDVDGDEAVISWHVRELERTLFPDLTTDSEAEDDESDEGGNDDDASDASEDEDTRDEAQSFYSLPRWAPPRMANNMAEYDPVDSVSSMNLKLLQRGCSWPMLQTYDIAYHHHCGIILTLPSLNHSHPSNSDASADGINHIYLGWNIDLEHNDIEGAVYITEVLEDIKNHPSRWQMRPRFGEWGIDVWRLVQADETEDYDTTDTEIWLDAEDF